MKREEGSLNNVWLYYLYTLQFWSGKATSISHYIKVLGLQDLGNGIRDLKGKWVEGKGEEEVLLVVDETLDGEVEGKIVSEKKFEARLPKLMLEEFEWL